MRKLDKKKKPHSEASNDNGGSQRIRRVGKFSLKGWGYYLGTTQVLLGYYLTR